MVFQEITIKRNQMKDKLDLCLISYSGRCVSKRKVKKMSGSDFPGGPVVKNSAANAEDTGSILGPRRFHVAWGNQTRAPQLLACALESSSCSCWNPSFLEPVLHNKRNEKPKRHNEQ